MLSGFMKTFQSRRFPALICGLTMSVLAAACEKVPLLAPSGSTITLTAATNVLSTDGSTDIIGYVLEASGTPPHSGTRVTFTTTLGTIQPAEATTDVSGRVVVKFLAGAANGTARISATSGGATTGADGAITIAVGTAAVGNVALNASPATVPNNGGSTTITATVLDVNGNALSSAPVSFTSDAGTLSASIVRTDANGIAQTTLTTSQTTKVTARVGAQAPATGGTGGNGGTGGTGGSSSGQAVAEVEVKVAAAPQLVITPPSTPPSAGLPASFTFAVTAAATGGSAVRSLVVNWGDGTTTNLGAVTGNAVASHVYTRTGTYTVTATVTDAAGNVSSVSTAVTVIPVPRPTIRITSSPVPAKVNTQTTITIVVETPPGISVTSTTIDFGDGTSASLGGAQNASIQKVYTSTGTFTVTVTVVDTAGQTTTGTTVISVGI